MLVIKRKHFYWPFIIFFFIFLTNCQLNKVNKSHGISYIENRAKVLIVAKSNKNDVIDVLGMPHSKGINNLNNWIYFERRTTKGKIYTLGKNVLKDNNVLQLEFDKFGILKTKKILDKKDMKKIKYAKQSTENKVSQPSKTTQILQSIRQKMYRNVK